MTKKIISMLAVIILAFTAFSTSGTANAQRRRRRQRSSQNRGGSHRGKRHKKVDTGAAIAIGVLGVVKGIADAAAREQERKAEEEEFRRSRRDDDDDRPRRVRRTNDDDDDADCNFRACAANFPNSFDPDTCTVVPFGSDGERQRCEM